MNVTNLPTNTFSVSNTIAEANVLDGTTDTPLGDAKYLLLMWSSSVTAFSGDGAGSHIGAADRLGGLCLK